jgi:hypothetical protein
MSTVYATTRRRRFRHRRPTLWQALIAQFRYVLEVGL